ncbi:hypothetical protein Trydic_g7274 [Trypoxylus dichotomus]
MCINTDNDIDTAVKQFEKDITLALNSAITTKLRIPRDRIPNYIKIKIHQEKLLYTHYKRTLHPNAKTLLNNITNEIKKDLAEIINNNSDKTEEFANYFEKTFRLNPPVDRNREKNTDVINKEVHTEYRDTINIQETTTEELRNIIKTPGDRKAPRHDGITNTAIETSDLRSRRYAERNYKHYN